MSGISLCSWAWQALNRLANDIGDTVQFMATLLVFHQKNEPGNCQCTVAIYFVQNLVIQFLLFCLIPLLKTKSATHKLSLHTLYLKVSLSAELDYWLNILFNVIDN